MSTPGHGRDEGTISAVLIEDRVFKLEENGILPSAIVETLADSWDRDGKVTLAEVEDWLESIPDLISLDCRMWGLICEHVLPELYGEPPKCLKRSHAVPHSKAKMAALTRRWEGKTQLWNPLDTHGILAISHKPAEN